MQIEKFQNEEMYALFAPDGSWQPMFTALDFATCVALIKLVSDTGISLPFDKMMKEGYKILPVKITVVQNGDENKPFKNK